MKSPTWWKGVSDDHYLVRKAPSISPSRVPLGVTSPAHPLSISAFGNLMEDPPMDPSVVTVGLSLDFSILIIGDLMAVPPVAPY